MKNIKLILANRSTTAVKNLIVVLIIALATLNHFGQSLGSENPAKEVPESTQSRVELVRPEKVDSLRKFVATNFANRLNKETMLETTVDGKPAITFSFAEGEFTTASILIDNGSSLELHSDRYPTAWKGGEIADYLENQDEPLLRAESFGSQNEQTDLAAAAVPTCAGIASPGNPYPCCTVGSNTKLGNCTFYAWHVAKTFWGYSMPTWGTNGASNAGNWYDNARNISGLPTSRTPALYSIAVSSSLSSYGHVAWPMELANDMVLVYEQACGSTTLGVTQKWRTVATFNKGYILSPTSAPKPTVSLATVGPIFKSNSTQPISFRVTNVNPGKRAVVIFPDGGRATLKDAQLSGVSNGLLTAFMTLGSRGSYKIQMFNENGKFSDLATFYVN